MDLDVPELDARSRVILNELHKGAALICVDEENNVFDRASSVVEVRPPSEGFSFMVAVAFSVNYIMGAGFLTLPWAFAKTGYLSFLVILAITAASVSAANMMLESMARADVYTHKFGNVVEGGSYGEVFADEEIDNSKVGSIDLVSPAPLRDGCIDSPQAGNRESEEAISISMDNEYRKIVVDREGQNNVGAKKLDCANEDSLRIAARELSSHSLGAIERLSDMSENDKDSVEEEGTLYCVKERRFEVVELCSMFLGPWLQFTYMISLCFFLFGGLWAYGTVFANALASNIPIPGTNSYLVYLFLFGLIVVPISCMELEEQKLIQVILSCGRVLMVLLMVSTIAISWIWGNKNDFGDELDGGGTLESIDFSGIHHLLPVAAFAHVFHHAIPSLSDPVIDKKKLSNIFTVTFVCCFFAYSAMSLSVSLYFGSKTLSSSNLNWVHYGINSLGFLYFIKRVVATFIVMFPALDVASAFPLNTVTLGNNLFSVTYGKKAHQMNNSKWHKTVFRLLGAIPPLIMAAIVSDLGQITDYTGISGFWITFIFPALLSYYSQIKMSGKGLSTGTLYSNVSTRPEVCFCLAFIGIFLTIYVPIALQ